MLLEWSYGFAVTVAAAGVQTCAATLLAPVVGPAAVLYTWWRMECGGHLQLDLDRSIGQGAFASVFRAKWYRRDVAVKFPAGSIESDANRELAMLRLVQKHGPHPHMVKFRGCAWHGVLGRGLVFDLHLAGDLYSSIYSDRRPLAERLAAVYLRNLLQALQHLHRVNLFHRDVKPNNLLLRPGGDGIVLTDFGSATLTSDECAMQSFAGTFGYASPEMILQQATGCEGDVFGAGATFYFMLSARSLFYRANPVAAARKTLEGCIAFGKGFDGVAETSKTLICNLVKVNVEERWTAGQALELCSRHLARTFI